MCLCSGMVSKLCCQRLFSNDLATDVVNMETFSLTF